MNAAHSSKRPSRSTRKMIALLFLVTLAACTLGPNFDRPEAPVGAGYSSATPPGRHFLEGAQIADDWYRLFHSDALNALVRTTLAENPDLESARHGLLAAQDELKAVAGAELPSLGASAGLTRAHINGSYLYEPVKAIDVTGNQYSAGLNLAYDLDIFGGIRRSIESEAAKAANTRDETLNTYVSLVDQTVVAAFDYAAAEAEIGATRTLIREQQDQLDLTRRQEQAGKINHSDTLQAETLLETTRASLPALEKQRDVSRNALARLNGKSPDQFAMPALALKDFTLPAEMPISLPSALIRQRPDILAAEDTLHAAEAQIGVAAAARLPSLTISAQYAQEATTLRDLFTQPGGLWTVGGNIAAPLFEGGTLAARETEARDLYRKSLAAYRGTAINAMVEVANALQAIGHDASGYDAHSRALASAAAGRDLTLAQFRAGKVSELQVLVAEQQYQTALLSHVQADVLRFTDVAELMRALGGGWWNATNDPTALPAVASAATTGP